MHPLFFTFLCAVLHFVSSDILPENIEVLMDNVLVLRPESLDAVTKVPISCGGAYENETVFWKKNGVPKQSLLGNQINILVKEMIGANYSCHLDSTGEYLNHTVVMVQLKRTVILENKSPNGDHIYCSALNYNGSFHCNWTRTEHRRNATVLMVKAVRSQEDIQCVLDADGSGVSCQYASCHHSEEQHRIFLDLYIYSNLLLEGYNKSFYLREIVRPAQLPNLQLINGREFRWDYPESWEKPCSFFGLQFQVKAVPKGHSCDSEDILMPNVITEKTKYVVNQTTTKKYVLCVQAQDKFTLGPWSAWSQHKVTKAAGRAKESHSSSK